MKKTFILFTLQWFTIFAMAQLTGTWEGDIANEATYQLNIVEVNGKICGYYEDNTYSGRGAGTGCMANCEGNYVKKDNVSIIKGTSFLKASKGHQLLIFTLNLDSSEKTPRLIGYMQPVIRFLGPYKVVFTKKSNYPNQPLKKMVDCIERNLSTPELTANDVALRSALAPANIDTIYTKKDTSTTIIDVVKINKVDPIEQLPLLAATRINKVFSKVVLQERKLTLKVYDVGTVDGDTISILYNNKVILHKHQLSDKALVIDLLLDENTDTHTIVLYAENLGAIPPNTALIVFITADGKRYALQSSATLEQNAAFLFEYKSK
jgi:hypothetical protein